ncbi:MAG TPA: cytochrome c [Rhodocyclaceae bacterium]|nr:cytochrome c [Rhodocyclaceae bacterium]
MHKTARTVLACVALAAAQTAIAEQGALERGEHVYTKVCSYCHDAGVGPEIRGRQLPASYIEHVVRHGYRAMPAFRPSEIDDQALAGVVEWVSASTAAPRR